jgi:uncharacterized integral membrane protein
VALSWATEQAYDEDIPESTTSRLEVPAIPAHPDEAAVMSNDLRHTQPGPADPHTAVWPESPADQPATMPATSSASRVPRTRTGAAWFGICAAALLFVVLIVFMLQNTRNVEVSFLGMHGNLPLALALLVAAVGAAILAMVVGAARITQLRRLSRRQRR